MPKGVATVIDLRMVVYKILDFIHNIVIVFYIIKCLHKPPSCVSSTRSGTTGGGRVGNGALRILGLDTRWAGASRDFTTHILKFIA